MKKIKAFKKIFVALLILVFMTVPVNAQAAIQTGKYETVTAAANAAREDILQHKPLITVYIKSKINDPETVFYEFRDEVFKETANGDEGDYMYWDINKEYPTYVYKSGKVGNTTYYYYTFKSQIYYFTTLQQKLQVDQRVKELIAGFGFTAETTDYEKVKTIYDYICNNVTYADDINKDIVYTSWSALFNGEAVCQGYAQLLYRMLKEVGISTRVIPGWGSGSDINHGWNIVKLGDYYYNVDATWDAQYAEKNQPYQFFLKGDNFLLHTRFDEYNTPEFYANYPMAASDYGITITPQASAASQRASFSIIKPKFKSVSGKKIRLTKVVGAYKYQIKYSTKKTFKKKTTKTVNTKKRTYKIKKIKKNRKYYVKFRAYKYIDGIKTYTQWSKIKKTKIK